MLREFDKDHARSGSGIYTVEEIRSAAGAVCAARLIRDIDAISLADHEESPTIPSYRSLGMLPPDRVIAALGRRVFVAGPEPESVDFAHRTTAECVARRPRPKRHALRSAAGANGVDGHPAPELRGLHAWLAVHLDLPEHVEG